MDRYQLSQAGRSGSGSRQMGYPNQMLPQSQRSGAIGTTNPMMGRAPNGRSDATPSWATQTPANNLSKFGTYPSQRQGLAHDDNAHQMNQRPAQSFREDDFPALGTGPNESSSLGTGSYAAISNGATGRRGPAPDNASFDDFPSLPGMLSSDVKGMPQIGQQNSGPSGYTHGSSNLTNANLQQHRSSLLGAMTQGRSTPNSQYQGNNTTQSEQTGNTRSSAAQDPRFGRAINAPPNLSLMNGPPALGGSSVEGPPGTGQQQQQQQQQQQGTQQTQSQQHHEEPSAPRSANSIVHTRDRGGDLSVPLPSHAPGLSGAKTPVSEPIRKSKDAAVPVEENEPLSETEKYTIKGLLPVIRKSNPDASMLALGSDLTSLGLKHDPDDDRMLSSIWSSPWSDRPNLTALPEAGWRVPNCYSNDMQGVLPPADLKIGNFAEETLFYIFYTQPRDRMQEHAAQELTARNWRFHKSLGLWLTKEPGIEPQLHTSTMERGMYVFWDSARWERTKKVFELYYEDLEDRFHSPNLARTQQQQTTSSIGADRNGVAGGSIAQERS